MKNFLKIILISLLVSFSGPALSDNIVQDTLPKEAEKFIGNLGRVVIHGFKYSKLAGSYQDLLLQRVFREFFDTESISKFVLGRYSRNATEEELVDFHGAFGKYLTRLYTSQFKYYVGEEFIVKGSMRIGRRDTVLVFVNVVLKNNRILRFVFQVKKTRQKGLQIVDVRVEGISMVVALRSEYTSYIRNHNGSVQALIDALNKRIASTESQN